MSKISDTKQTNPVPEDHSYSPSESDVRLHDVLKMQQEKEMRVLVRSLLILFLAVLFAIPGAVTASLAPNATIGGVPVLMWCVCACVCVYARARVRARIYICVCVCLGTAMWSLSLGVCVCVCALV